MFASGCLACPAVQAGFSWAAMEEGAGWGLGTVPDQIPSVRMEVWHCDWPVSC